MGLRHMQIEPVCKPSPMQSPEYGASPSKGYCQESTLGHKVTGASHMHSLYACMFGPHVADGLTHCIADHTWRGSAAAMCTRDFCFYHRAGRTRMIRLSRCRMVNSQPVSASDSDTCFWYVKSCAEEQHGPWLQSNALGNLMKTALFQGAPLPPPCVSRSLPMRTGELCFKRRQTLARVAQ